MKKQSQNQLEGISISDNNLNTNELHHQKNKLRYDNPHKYLERQIDSKEATRKLSIQGGDNQIKVVVSFIVIGILIALTIAVIRQNSSQNDHSQNVQNLQTQFQDIKYEMNSMKEKQQKRDSVEILKEEFSKKVQNDSKLISSLTYEMVKAFDQIQQLKSEFTQNYKDISLKDERDSSQIISLSQMITNTKSQLEFIQSNISEIKEQNKENSSTLIDYKLSIALINKEIEATNKGQQEAISLQSKMNEQIQNDIKGIQVQLNAEIVSLNEQKLNVGLIEKDIEVIRKESEEVSSLSKIVSVLQTDSSRLKEQMTDVQIFSPKIEGISVKIEEIKSNLNNVNSLLSRQYNSVYYYANNTSTSTNIESEIALIKQSITNLQSSIYAGGIVNSIQSYGPFFASSRIQALILNGNNFLYFQTTQECQIKTKGKSIITLIATGLGICDGCHGQVTFLKNRKQILPSAGEINHLNGASFLFVEWLPINLTQEFFVEEGTYEFVLGTNLPNGGSNQVRLQNLSFVVKVMQYSL